MRIGTGFSITLNKNQSKYKKGIKAENKVTAANNPFRLDLGFGIFVPVADHQRVATFIHGF
jgi:hypothetical protein